MNLSAKEHVASYNLRWPQEKINRTAKQKFGVNQCQALSALKQEAHIMAGYLAYAIIEIAKKDKQDKSVDEVVTFLRRDHFDDLVELFGKPATNHCDNNIDSVDINFQNHVQTFQENTGESAIFRG